MERWMLLCVMIVSIICIGKSLVTLFRHPKIKGNLISFSNLIILFIVYLIIIFGFGCVYITLLLLDIPVLIEGGLPLSGSYFQLLEAVFYFSSVTLLSVGYGDITPVGLGRWISIIEALLGYLMPAAFVLSTVLDRNDAKKL
jgi:potassium channel LctB